jgi:hypothetical protein
MSAVNSTAAIGAGLPSLFLGQSQLACPTSWQLKYRFLALKWSRSSPVRRVSGRLVVDAGKDPGAEMLAEFFGVVLLFELLPRELFWTWSVAASASCWKVINCLRAGAKAVRSSKVNLL